VFISWNVNAEHEADMDLAHAFYSTGNAIKRRGADSGLVVLDGTFDNHGDALALKVGSPIRKAVNLALLQFFASDWTALLQRYLGSS
jgi:hypothetical protein